MEDMASERPPLSGMSILVVEDDFLLADDARVALENAGARVIGPVPDVARGVAALEAHRPDCALLDINLGSGSSFEAAKAATRLGVPFVFVTGYDEQYLKSEFNRAERIQKPVTSKDLIAAVVRACQGGLTAGQRSP